MNVHKPKKGGDPKGTSGQRPPTPATPINQHKQLAGAAKTRKT